MTAGTCLPGLYTFNYTVLGETGVSGNITVAMEQLTYAEFNYTFTTPSVNR